MHLTIVNLLGTTAPFILIATLWSIRKEGRKRSVTLRMLPSERRPSANAVQPVWFARGRGASSDRVQHATPLWTLRDCQMELLTEATMHAFEAIATAYVPERRASNYPPGGLRQRITSSRAEADIANRTSILLRTLERKADMLSAGAAAIHQGEPTLDNSSSDTLSYRDSAQRVRILRAA